MDVVASLVFWGFKCSTERQFRLIHNIIYTFIYKPVLFPHIKELGVLFLLNSVGQ